MKVRTWGRRPRPHLRPRRTPGPTAEPGGSARVRGGSGDPPHDHRLDESVAKPVLVTRALEARLFQDLPRATLAREQRNLGRVKLRPAPENPAQEKVHSPGKHHAGPPPVGPEDPHLSAGLERSAK